MASISSYTAAAQSLFHKYTHKKKYYNRAVSSFECFEGHTFLFQHHRTAEDGWDMNSGIHTMTPVLERKEGYLSRKNTNPLCVGGNIKI